ncbi:MAG: C39 family peptidase [Lachnospiraceae bacterium]|nr:C39 family peptidase [Lachnospiraceae bacterium]
MGSRKKFIMKSAVTVCLLAVLFMEGLFLYCHYIKRVSVARYVAEKWEEAGEWFFHSGTQTANAQPPSRIGSRKTAFAASVPVLPQTAAYVIREMFGEGGDAFMIPERGGASVSSDVSSNGASVSSDVSSNGVSVSSDVSSNGASVSSDVSSDGPSDPKTKADPAEPEEKAEGAGKADQTDASREEAGKEKVKAGGSKAESTPFSDLLKRQEADGLVPIEDSRIQLEAESILQYPELPTGCEVTSLTMALRFAGYDVSKEELADRYLDKTTPGSVSYKEAFWGDPRQAESFGCYAPVIVNAANKYLAEKESQMQAYDLTGTSLDDVLTEVRMGSPVIVWGSMYINEEIVFSYGWEIDGETVTWPSNEHCMLLIGFDMENDSVIVCDPLEGVVSYDKGAFQHHYEILGQQAIVIY